MNEKTARPLKLLLLFGVNSQTGYGHKYRSLALAKVAQEHGHTVYIASDQKPPSVFKWFPIDYLNQAQITRALELTQPDWLIVDLPHTPPAWIREAATCKICTLNGIGYNQLEGSNLRIIQGGAQVDLPGQQDQVPTLKGLEYIILRPEIAKYQDLPRGEFTMVWGGGTDSMNLLQKYADWFPDDKAFFLVADMTPIPILTSRYHWLLRLNQDSDDALWWMAKAKRLVTAMGMVVPESAHLKTPTYVFNASELHLSFARAMAEAGLIQLWDSVGLPSNREEVKRFIDTPYQVADRLDSKGAERVMKAIEERS